MNIGLLAMSGVRLRTKELAELGVTLYLPASVIVLPSKSWAMGHKLPPSTPHHDP